MSVACSAIFSAGRWVELDASGLRAGAVDVLDGDGVAEDAVLVHVLVEDVEVEPVGGCPPTRTSEPEFVPAWNAASVSWRGSPVVTCCAVPSGRMKSIDVDVFGVRVDDPGEAR